MTNQMNNRGLGEKCEYCKRGLVATTSRTRLAATRDHTVPRSRSTGPRATVWCCRQCNTIKKDMMPDDWAAFMESFPTWWEHPEFKDWGVSHRYAGTIESATQEKPRKKPTTLKIATMPVNALPLEYPNDPLLQLAFERVYAKRLHLLRVQVPLWGDRTSGSANSPLSCARTRHRPRKLWNYNLKNLAAIAGLGH